MTIEEATEILNKRNYTNHRWICNTELGGPNRVVRSSLSDCIRSFEAIAIAEKLEREPDLDASAISPEH